MVALPEDVQLLVDAGHRAPSPDNAQPWLFCWDGRALELRYAEGRGVRDLFPPGGVGTLLTMGAVIENLRQIAGVANITLREDEAAVDLDSGRYFRATVESSNVDYVAARRHELFTRHTNRMPYSRQPLDATMVASVGHFKEGGARVAVFTERAAVGSVARLVRFASQLRFQNREIHEWFARSLRFTAEKVAGGDGLDVKTLGLPPGGATLLRFTGNWQRMAALNTLGMYRFFARVEAQAVERAPAIVAIVAPRSQSEAIHAGRLMERAWIELNAQGVAVQPYYVLSDQLQRFAEGRVEARHGPLAARVDAEARRLWGLEDEHLYILFRIGYLRRQPILSKRLKVDRAVRVEPPAVT